MMTEVRIPVGEIRLAGDRVFPENARGWVLFAHGSGSSRLSPRNRRVAGLLREAGFATLLFDLLTEKEARFDAVTDRLRFDVGFLAGRLQAATQWLQAETTGRDLPLGYFGASTGAAAALVAAGKSPGRVKAVVSRGGRPDLAGESLGRVRAPTLFIVGEYDQRVLDLNRVAAERLAVENRLEVVPQAGHLFEEPGKLDAVASLAADWFQRHL